MSPTPPACPWPWWNSSPPNTVPTRPGTQNQYGSELGGAFAEVWCALPKVVFSRTLDSVVGNARLAEASVAEEAAAALAATDKDVSIGGAGLAAAAIELGLVDELRMFRNPVVVGGGTPFLPPVTEDVRLDLVETRTFGSRVIYERYGRARDESD